MFPNPNVCEILLTGWQAFYFTIRNNPLNSEEVPLDLIHREVWMNEQSSSLFLHSWKKFNPMGGDDSYRGLKDSFLHFLILNGGLFEADSGGSFLVDREVGEVLKAFLTFTLLPNSYRYFAKFIAIPKQPLWEWIIVAEEKDPSRFQLTWWWR